MLEEQMRPVFWVGDSKERLLEFPDEVQNKVGYILEGVQAGRTSNKIKRLSGFSGVYEIVSYYASDAYRMVYVVNLGDTIYVLHCFQKKSKRGIKTPKMEIGLIHRRLKRAKEHAQQEYQK